MTELHVLYRFFDAEDRLLYVGITKSPLVRMSQHLRDKAWFKTAARTTYEHFSSRMELEAAEVRAIQSEQPKYNIAHSVGPVPTQIPVKPKVGYSYSRDANRFQAPDAIASDEPTEGEREARLVELQRQFDQRSVHIPRKPCPSCDLVLLVREHDGLIKCLHCMDMFLPEDIPSDLKYAMDKLKESS